MCTNYTEKTEVFGSAKGPAGWFKVNQATVYYDHPFFTPLEHSLNIDFTDINDPRGTRVAVELSAESARDLARTILSALEGGERELSGNRIVAATS